MARPGFWIDTVLDTPLVVNVQNNQSLMGAASLTDDRLRWTCVRTIIGLDVARAVHDSGEGSHIVYGGIAIVSQQAFATSGAISAVEQGDEFPTRGWLWKSAARVWGFAANDPTVYTWRIDKDIRAKRKLDNGEMIIAFKSIADEGAAATLQVNGLVRQYWLDA